MTIRLLKCCDSKAITLVPVHLPGVHNIQADSLSRVCQTLTTEWTMAIESLRPVFAKWGELQIDLFATFANRRLVKFVSPYLDPRAEWTDAMSMPWDYGRDLLVRVPVIQDGPASTAEDRSVTRSGGDFDRSTATGSIMVPRVDGPIPRRSDSAVHRRSRPTDTRRLDGRWGDRERHFRPSNLLAWKLSGPSWEQRVIPGKLPTWCQGAFGNLHNKCMNPNGQDSWHSVGRKDGKCHHFNTYMMHGLLPSTLISHRTSVASVLRHWVYDPAADPYNKLLVRVFRLERPVQRRIRPKWDLHLVLSLLRPPFISPVEVHGKSSDDVIPLKRRTLICVFLLALASARRRSYLHALSIASDSWVFGRGNTQQQLVVSLLSEPGFLVKNQLPTQAPEWITVPGIASWIQWNRRECYVPLDSWSSSYGTLKESGGGGGQSAYVHNWKCSFRDIMRSHVSRWIVETVKEAYTLKLIVSTTVWQRMRSERFQLHGRTTVRWLYLTSCQRRFGGLPGCSRIRICATWLVLLRACRHWVQWWLYNT